MLLRIQFIIFLFFSTVSYIYSQFTGDLIDGFQKDQNVVRLQAENATILIEICQSDIVRFRTIWEGKFADPEPYIVTKYDWPQVDFEVQESQFAILIATDQVNVKVTKKPFAIEISDKMGQILYHALNHQKTGEAVSAIQSLTNEHFFGFGERMDFLDRLGKKTELNVGRGIGRPHIVGAYDILRANYSPIPFFMSTGGYGIFLHNSYSSTWDMGATSADHYTFGADGGELDFYFMYGPDFKAILNSYTYITGKSPMMNRFAFGLHVGTYSGGTWGHEELTSGEYVVGLARKFRELGIPLDVLHLDSTWRIFGENGGKGATSFEWRETFTNPKAMFDSLYALNLNMVGVHLRPRFDNGKNMRLLDEAREKGFVYPENENPGEFVNFFDEKAVDWWWQNGVKKIADQGAMFLKTDEGSAFGRKANESNKVGPTGVEIKSLHNVFPLVYAKAPYTKFQEYNQLRGMNHTREGFAGIQRYPFIFAGDWPSEWQYFGPVIKAGLNMGLSGVGYWAHCMGGFEHAADPELYMRWVQFGLMSPVAHLFGMDHPGYKEPWSYGDDGVRIFKKYDEMRYELIPYMYSNAWEMYKSGTPLMRALVLEYQDDVNTYNIEDEYLLGASMLIAPVITKGAQTRTVYLPGGQWYSHWGDQVLEGNTYQNVLAPIDQMPIFYKAGAIIPRQPVTQFVGDGLPVSLTLDVYAGANGSFELYEDDGKSLNYQNGEYTITQLNYLDDDMTFSLGASVGDYLIPDRMYEVRFHGVASATDVKLIIGNKPKSKKLNWSFDSQSKIVKVRFEKKASVKVSIEIIE